MGHCALYPVKYLLIVFGDKTSDGGIYGGHTVKPWNKKITILWWFSWAYTRSKVVIEWQKLVTMMMIGDHKSKTQTNAWQDHQTRSNYMLSDLVSRVLWWIYKNIGSMTTKTTVKIMHELMPQYGPHRNIDSSKIACWNSWRNVSTW